MGARCGRRPEMRVWGFDGTILLVVQCGGDKNGFVSREMQRQIERNFRRERRVYSDAIRGLFPAAQNPFYRFFFFVCESYYTPARAPGPLPTGHQRERLPSRRSQPNHSPICPPSRPHMPIHVEPALSLCFSYCCLIWEASSGFMTFSSQPKKGFLDSPEGFTATCVRGWGLDRWNGMHEGCAVGDGWSRGLSFYG